MAHPGWQIPEGFMCVVTGWGMTDGNGSPAGSRLLRQAALNHMNDQDCYTLYQGIISNFWLNNDMSPLFLYFWSTFCKMPITYFNSKQFFFNFRGFSAHAISVAE
jgi:hypothetical protein